MAEAEAEGLNALICAARAMRGSILAVKLGLEEEADFERLRGRRFGIGIWAVMAVGCEGWGVALRMR